MKPTPKLKRPTPKPQPPPKPKNLCRPRSKSCDAPATKADLEKIRKIMSALGDQLKAVLDGVSEIGTDVDTLVTSVGGITVDVTKMKELIEKLQNNPGPISPEDQAIVDQLQTIVGGLVTKTKGVAEAAKALDEATEQLPEV